MPKRTLRASAKPLPKSDPHTDAERDAAILEYNQPGLR
jgi:hypothetical protein